MAGGNAQRLCSQTQSSLIKAEYGQAVVTHADVVPVCCINAAASTGLRPQKIEMRVPCTVWCLSELPVALHLNMILT